MLGKNFFAGIISSIWIALINFIVIPYYIRYLGIESYGLIGFFATMQTLFVLLDLGLAPTVSREVARCFAVQKLDKLKKIVHTFAVIYWIVAVLIGVIVVLLAPIIAAHWLQASQLKYSTIVCVVRLMGLVIACRWPISLYQGVLFGAQKIVISSTINMFIVTITNLVAVFLLMFFSLTIEMFFIWQACMGLCYAIVLCCVVWNVIGKEGRYVFDMSILKDVWKFSFGMTGIAIAAVILMQLDKLILSKLLDLADFGRYIIAGVLANSLYILLTPLFNVVYPRMTALVELGETLKLLDLYKTGSQLFLACFFPIVIVGALFSKDLFLLWTNNYDLSCHVSLISAFLLLGTGLNGVMHFPYALQLANGLTKIAFKITIVLIIISVPMVIFLSRFYGAIGGALAWLLLNCCYVFFGTWLTHKEILKHEALNWLVNSVFFPFFVSLIVIVLGWKLVYPARIGYYNVFWACCLCVLSMSINLLLMPGKTMDKLNRLGLLGGTVKIL